MSFKIPCGGFRLDEESFSLDENGVLSIPKPLTYDYMPEGYPSKSVETVTLTGAAFTGWSFWYVGVPGQTIDTPMLEWSWEFCTPNVLIATFGAFLMFSCIGGKSTPRLVGLASRLSFGMYLMHLFFLSNIAPIFVNGDLANPLLPVWLSIPSIAVFTFMFCFITTWGIYKLPGSKWIVGC